MIYFYKVTDLANGNVSSERSDIDEFSSYRDFIANLEALNEIYAGELRFEEDREEIRKNALTRQFEMV